MLAIPCAAELYEIWHTRSTHRHNHVRQIFSQSVQRLQSSDTPKLPFPIDLLRRPYNSVRTAVRHCDQLLVILVLLYLLVLLLLLCLRPHRVEALSDAFV